jgi:hypothetical protein
VATLRIKHLILLAFLLITVATSAAGSAPLRVAIDTSGSMRGWYRTGALPALVADLRSAAAEVGLEALAKAFVAEAAGAAPTFVDWDAWLADAARPWGRVTPLDAALRQSAAGARAVVVITDGVHAPAGAGGAAAGTTEGFYRALGQIDAARALRAAPSGGQRQIVISHDTIGDGETCADAVIDRARARPLRAGVAVADHRGQIDPPHHARAKPQFALARQARHDAGHVIAHTQKAQAAIARPLQTLEISDIAQKRQKLHLAGAQIAADRQPAAPIDHELPAHRPAIGREARDIEHQPPPRQRGCQIDGAKRDIAKAQRAKPQRDLGIGGEKPAHIDGRARPALAARGAVITAGKCQRISRDRATDHRTLCALGQVKRQHKGGLIKLQPPVAQMRTALITQRDLPR